MDGIMPNPTLERRLGDFMENRQESSPQKSGQESNGTVYSTTRINILKFFKSSYFCHFCGSDNSHSSYFINRRLSWQLFRSSSVTVYQVSETLPLSYQFISYQMGKGQVQTWQKRKYNNSQPQFLCRWDSLKKSDYLYWKKYGLRVGSRHPWR